MSLENQWGTRLDLVINRDGKKITVKIPISGDTQQEVIGVLEHYYGRAATAIAYQQSLQAPEQAPAEPNETFSLE